MKRFASQLKKSARSVSLRASERHDLREQLVSYMEYHPLPKERRGTTAPTTIAAWRQRVGMKLKAVYISGAAGACAVVLLVGVPFVAEQALPGDTLYPVKVRFNEQIRSTFTASQYEKVEWETTRLERRIAEARRLASEGRLTPEAEQAVTTAVRNHSAAAKREIASLRETDSDGAAIAEIAFTSVLEVQSEVLENSLKRARSMEVVDGEPASGTSVEQLAALVAEERNAARADESKSLPSYERLVGRVEMETTRAYELFAYIQTIATEKEIADIERRLSDIERKLTAAQTLHTATSAPVMATSSTPSAAAATTATTTVAAASTTLTIATATAEAATTTTSIVSATSTSDTASSTTSDTAEAIAREDIQILRSVLGDVQKLIRFMTDIDVREYVTVDELVPLTPTDDEIEEQSIALAAQLERSLSSLRETLSSRPDDDQTAAFTSALEEVETLAARTDAAVAEGNFAVAITQGEKGVAAAQALAEQLRPTTTSPINSDGQGSTSTSTSQSTSTDAAITDEVESATPAGTSTDQR